jgi:hypothetical protein
VCPAGAVLSSGDRLSVLAISMVRRAAFSRFGAEAGFGVFIRVIQSRHSECGRTSAPRLPQALQTNRGSMPESLTLSGHCQRTWPSSVSIGSPRSRWDAGRAATGLRSPKVISEAAWLTPRPTAERKVPISWAISFVQQPFCLPIFRPSAR